VGGDEFAVLLEQNDAPATELVAGRILKAVAAHSPASAGWASCPEDGDTAEELYRRADTRLYERKGLSPVSRG
jgi:GGDEF domain-containing protein